MIHAATQAPRSRSLYAALAEAAEDPIVRRVLNRVASARIVYLEACYRELGLAPPHAKAKAVFAYAAYRGLLQLAHEAPSVLPTDWSCYAAVVHDALDGRSRRLDNEGTTHQTEEGPKLRVGGSRRKS